MPEAGGFNGSLDSGPGLLPVGAGTKHRDDENIESVGWALSTVPCLGFFFSSLFSAAVIAQPVTPFFSANQSPVIQVHNLPAMGSAGVLEEGRARYRLVSDLANNYTFADGSNETLLFDGETTRSTFSYARGFGKDLEWGVQIPYVQHSGGSLDAFIEHWHDTFGLPQGGRTAAPRNRLRYFYQRNGITRLLLTEAAAGIGDLRLTVGWQRPDGDARVAIRGALSLPTGDSDQLRGSGAPELALWASADDDAAWFGFPGGLFGGGGLLLMGDGDVLADQQRRLAAFGSVGAGARVLPWMSLKVQLDANSSFYGNSRLTQLNATAVQLLMGGDLQLGRHTRLEIMVAEDIIVHASPDVVFHLGLSME